MLVNDFETQIYRHKTESKFAFQNQTSTMSYIAPFRCNHEPLARMAQSAIIEHKQRSCAVFYNTRISFFLCWVLFSFLAKRKKNLTGIVSVASAPKKILLKTKKTQNISYRHLPIIYSYVSSRSFLNRQYLHQVIFISVRHCANTEQIS